MNYSLDLQLDCQILITGLLIWIHPFGSLSGIIILIRYKSQTIEKINSPLPEENNENWPQENINKLKNIRGAKITLGQLCVPEVHFAPLWMEDE